MWTQLGTCTEPVQIQVQSNGTLNICAPCEQGTSSWACPMREGSPRSGVCSIVRRRHYISLSFTVRKLFMQRHCISAISSAVNKKGAHREFTGELFSYSRFNTVPRVSYPLSLNFFCLFWSYVSFTPQRATTNVVEGRAVKVT